MDTTNLLITLVPVVVVWVLALRPLSETALQRWATRYGAPLDDATRPLLRRRIHIGRSIRATGATVGILVSSLPGLTGARGGSFAVPIVSSAWLIGTSVGVLVAELAARRRPVGSVRRASLEVRRVGDYVDRWTVGLAVAATAAVAVGVVAATGVGAARNAGEFETAENLLAAAVRSADEALRSEGAHHVVAVAVALGISGAAEAWGATVAVFSTVAAFPFGLLPLVGYGIWWALVHDTVWRVRHEAAQPS